MKEQVVGMARTTWREVIHRDDATDEEKGKLIERARNSPPMSRMYAFLHPFVNGAEIMGHRGGVIVFH